MFCFCDGGGGGREVRIRLGNERLSVESIALLLLLDYKCITEGS